MIALRKAIKSYLETLHPRVYYENAPDDATYPYIVFSLAPSITQDENLESRLVDIEGWDKPSDGSTLALETLMETINGDGKLAGPTGLNSRALSNSQIVAAFRLQSRLNVPDDNKQIKHIRYMYQVSVYERSN